MGNQVDSTLTGVPRTMLLTTRARVEEHQRENGLFRDPKVAEWWQFVQWDAELDRFYSSIAALAWAVRAERIDRAAQRHLTSHPNAIAIELGAGLSTRYYRVGQGSRCWLELDLPEITALRRQLETETDSHRFIARSVLDFSWMNEIPTGDPENLLVIAEGLLMYLEADRVRDFVYQLRDRFPGATLVFDVFGASPKSRGAKQLAQLGAPLKWFVKDEQEVAAMGLSLVQVLSLLQENCQYRDRIGVFRWISWINKLPPLRNASLIIEAKVQPLP
ncbi:class I SAM-dependent methyltransferase [Lusitaniella coriacea LEGE 07157]|uniref:Class I SAM-dependent methyltransferase n=1 Tax=Lusitaniella coriacea LEGE 07157 TaxID=945747 RepID=A0A8J7E167_9CYAN|nr:class I SAM-dependent methyltransferase [Lusitaniella coriacea]MBE9118353.1 class I SAM-dependent methyltransferase [Lusitaniella coriacea LEGE 07157]